MFDKDLKRIIILFYKQKKGKLCKYDEFSDVKYTAANFL